MEVDITEKGRKFLDKTVKGPVPVDYSTVLMIIPLGYLKELGPMDPKELVEEISSRGPKVDWRKEILGLFEAKYIEEVK